MDEFITAVRALGDPNRVRALMALRNGELCLCQIIELLGLAPSTTSKHMSILKNAGLVKGRKEEKWIYFSLAEIRNANGVAGLISACIEQLSKDDIVKNDEIALEKILNVEPEIICKKQRCC